MSNEIDYAAQQTEKAFAFLFHSDNVDALTDILVDALEDAFRILTDEIASERLN